MSRRFLTTDTSEYHQLATQEIEHYSKIFLGEDHSAVVARQNLVQPVPPSWINVESRAAQMVRRQTGMSMTEHLVDRLTRNAGARMLSLGSGPGGIEISLAHQARAAEIVCLDLNPDLVKLGRERAAEEQLNIQFETADLNTVDLPKRDFDLIFCHASLHHVLELERLASQIKQAMRPNAELIVVDVVTRNGYLMWPDSREIVHSIWRTMPPRFRINHTAYFKPRVDDMIWEADTSETSMECIRAEDILPALNSCFRVSHFVPYFSISRRFFDTMYGPNYDLDNELDSSILNWVWSLDVHYIEKRILRPETFFGIYRRE